MRLPVALTLLLAAALVIPATAAHTVAAAAAPPTVKKQLVNGQWRPDGLPQPTSPPAATADLSKVSLSDAILQQSSDPERWLRIALSSYNGGDWNIHRVSVASNPELGGTLVNFPLTRGEGDDLGPRLSPDAGQIAFYSDRRGNFDIFRMTWDGAGLTQLTAHPANDIAPAWSPDGTRIAFASQRNGAYDIYTINNSGGQLTQLTTDPAADVSPAWAPDGGRIAWVRVVGPDSAAIWVMNADGSEQRALTPPLRYAGGPQWSPDGSLIAFDYDHDGDGRNVPALINPDGSDLRRVSPKVDYGAYDFLVTSWSPEGARLVVDSFAYFPPEAGGGLREVFVSRINIADGRFSPIGYVGEALETQADARSIDHVPPQTAMRPLEPFERAGPIEIAWSGSDPTLASLLTYDVQYQIDGGAWSDWKPFLSASERSATYTGVAGQSVAFRIRGRDEAGNVEPWRPAPDASTTFYATNLRGGVHDNRGRPTGANVQVSPAGLGAVATSSTGDYAVRLKGQGAHTVSISAPGFTAPPPTMLTMGQDRRFEAALLPADNLLTNSGFEASLGGWALGTAGDAARAAGLRFSGAAAARLGAPCAEPCLSPAETPIQPGLGEKLFVGPDGGLHLVQKVYIKHPEWVYWMAYQRRLPDGTWSPREIIGRYTAEAIDFQLAVAPSGAVDLVTSDTVRNLIAYRRSPTGVWSGPADIGPGDLPKLYLDDAGRLFVLFQCSSRPDCRDSQGDYLRVRAANGSWGALRRLSVPVVAQSQTPDGRIFIIWASDGDPRSYFAGELRPDGSLANTRYLFDADQRYSLGGLSAFAVDSQGTVHIVASAAIDDFGYITCLHGHSCSPPLSVPGKNGDYALAIDRQDTLHLVTSYSSIGSSFGAIYQRLSLGGVWSAPLTVSDALYPKPAVSIDRQDALHLLIDGIYRRTPVAAARTSSLAQTVSIPVAMHEPTLSFAYSVGGLGPASKSRVTATVGVGGEPLTEVFSRTVSSPWGAAWVDLGAWAGKTVTVRFAVEQADGAPLATLALDDVALGSWLTPVPLTTNAVRLPTSTASTITISGENFVGTPQVWLGETALAGVQRVDERTLRASLPAGLRPGLYQLMIANPGGQRGVLEAVSIGERLNLPLLSR